MAESLIHAILKGQYICFEQATLILQESSLQVLKKIKKILIAPVQLEVQMIFLLFIFLISAVVIKLVPCFYVVWTCCRSTRLSMEQSHVSKGTPLLLAKSKTGQCLSNP